MNEISNLDTIRKNRIKVITILLDLEKFFQQLKNGPSQSIYIYICSFFEANTLKNEQKTG